MFTRMINGKEYEIKPDANLSGANLSGADLRRANLPGADLWRANLSGAGGLLNPIEYIRENFEVLTDDNGVVIGFYAYKSFGLHYPVADKWVIEPGSIIEEVVNPNRTDDCGCGVNVATKGWVQKKSRGSDFWKVLISGLDMLSVVVPYNTDGKIRVGRCQLIKIVNQ